MKQIVDALRHTKTVDIIYYLELQSSETCSQLIGEIFLPVLQGPHVLYYPGESLLMCKCPVCSNLRNLAYRRICM